MRSVEEVRAKTQTSTLPWDLFVVVFLFLAEEVDSSGSGTALLIRKHGRLPPLFSWPMWLDWSSIWLWRQWPRFAVGTCTHMLWNAPLSACSMIPFPGLLMAHCSASQDLLLHSGYFVPSYVEDESFTLILTKRLRSDGGWKLDYRTQWILFGLI